MRVTPLIITLFCLNANAQTFTKKHNLGLTVGAVFNFGTHLQNIGIKIQGYANNKYLQLNAGNTFTLNLKSYGNRKTFIENRANLGIVGVFGNLNTQRHFIVDGLYHQTLKNYAVAYNYIYYWDNAGSTQFSGAFAIHIQNFSVLLENDIFAGQGRDRFRTGGIQIAYLLNENINVKLNTSVWTGETRGARIIKHKGKNYKNLSKLTFGKTTLGKLALGADYRLNYGQTIHCAFGIDSEKWRYVIQNKIVHAKSKNTNYYYPYLNDAGEPVFTKAEARKTKLYLHTGLNSLVFY